MDDSGHSLELGHWIKNHVLPWVWTWVLWLLGRLLIRKVKTMSISKAIPIGQVGSLVLAEEGGKATAAINLSVSEKAGEGSVEGFAKVSASVGVSAEVDAKLLIDAALDLAIAKFPGAASIIAGAKAAIDAELTKV